MADPYFAKDPDALLSPEALAAMSGRDFIRVIRDGCLPAPPIAEIMGMRLIEVEQGRVTFEGRPAFRHSIPSAPGMAAGSAPCSIAPCRERCRPNCRPDGATPPSTTA